MTEWKMLKQLNATVLVGVQKRESWRQHQMKPTVGVNTVDAALCERSI